MYYLKWDAPNGLTVSPSALLLFYLVDDYLSLLLILLSLYLLTLLQNSDDLFVSLFHLSPRILPLANPFFLLHIDVDKFHLLAPMIEIPLCLLGATFS